MKMLTLLCQGGMAIDFLTVVRIETLCAFYILILILENYLLSTNVCIRDGAGVWGVTGVCRLSVLHRLVYMYVSATILKM